MLSAHQNKNKTGVIFEFPRFDYAESWNRLWLTCVYLRCLLLFEKYKFRSLSCYLWQLIFTRKDWQVEDEGNCDNILVSRFPYLCEVLLVSLITSSEIWSLIGRCTRTKHTRLQNFTILYCRLRAPEVENSFCLSWAAFCLTRRIESAPGNIILIAPF